MNYKKQLKNFDFWLVLAICALSIFGILCIGSATHINLGDSPSTFYMQIVYFITGLAILFFVTTIDLDFFIPFYKIAYILNLLQLVLVLVIGTTVNNATRWIRIGLISLQPSEFCKLFMIFTLAKFLDSKREELNTLPILLQVAILTFIPVVLIQRQPSLSASLVVLAIMMVQLFVAGLSYQLIFRGLAVLVPVAGFCIFDLLRTPHLLVDKILNSYQINRITTFFRPETDPDSYYQTMKSINAIGSGQLTGKGLYEGTLNQLSYLPEPHNDFIFSVIGEEFGFVGCVTVLILLLFVVFRCILIAMETRDPVCQLMVAGVAGMIAFQTFVNVGVATGVMPNTGMSLPFVSSGGSSMWTYMAAIGLVLNIGLKRSRSLFEGV